MTKKEFIKKYNELDKYWNDRSYYIEDNEDYFSRLVDLVEEYIKND